MTLFTYFLGIVKTNLYQTKLAKFFYYLLYPVFIPPELGCQTILYCALDNQIVNESGDFYGNCTKFVNQFCTVVNYIANFACDDITAKRLWDLSCELVKLESCYRI